MANERKSLAERISAMRPRDRDMLLASLSDADIMTFLASWAMWAQPAQLPPAWHWDVWILMAGRGYGKTRAGAEWVHHVAQTPGVRIALVGATEDEVRRVMVEGSSGVLSCCVFGGRPQWEPSRGVLTFASGAQAFA